MSILPFDSVEATLESAGGKGINLARMTRAGFAVASGFIITVRESRIPIDNTS